MKSWLENNDIEMYLIYNEGTFVITERFIRTLKNLIYKMHDFNIKKCVY